MYAGHEAAAGNGGRAAPKRVHIAPMAVASCSSECHSRGGSFFEVSHVRRPSALLALGADRAFPADFGSLCSYVADTHSLIMKNYPELRTSP